MTNFHFDAIVVGSGISGGWAAKELCEKGLKTLVLERGPQYRHREDYQHDASDPWTLPLRGKVNETLARNEYHVQSKVYEFKEFNRERFVNDKAHPYVQEQPFDWIRGYQTGGRSIIWGRQCYRLSDLDFEANALDGHGTDWPIRYADLAPWYDYVERFAGICGNRDGLPHLPDGIFQPAMEMTCVEADFAKNLQQHFPQRHLIHGRAAHLTQPTAEQQALGRGQCLTRNKCSSGCVFGAYFSSQSATLPAADRTGNLQLRHDSIVKEVLYDSHTKRATGVVVIDRISHQEQTYYANVIFLCASTLGTTQILLNSVSTAFPNGLANSSGTLGKYLMDHTMLAGAFATVDGYEDRYYAGRRPTGTYIPRFRNLQQPQDYLRGFGYQVYATRDNWRAGNNKAGIGADFKAQIEEAGSWRIGLYGFGEMLPQASNGVTLDPKEKDEWGIPLLRFNVKWGENEHKMREDMANSAVEMLERCGFKNVRSLKVDHAPGLAIHEMGTARMGKDPTTSVLNRHNQCHDVANLFVTDGAAMSSSGCQNPSLTYMALTARAVDFAVKTFF